MSELSYEVWVSEGIPRNRPMRLPDGGPIVSSPVSAVLIYGEQDAVLVDPPFTREQTEKVGDWVQGSGMRLTHIYATHGHGDHWFGTAQRRASASERSVAAIGLPVPCGHGTRARG